MTEHALKFAPVGNDEKRLDVALEADQAVIRLSNWVDGLGWCVQKTMQIEPDMLDELHRLIGAARIRVRNNLTDESQSTGVSPRVLDFPVLV